MDLTQHIKPANLERYSFLWSLARLMIAAVALFLGGVPPILKFNPRPTNDTAIHALLTLSWLISGAASGYLLFRWYAHKKILFGSRVPNDATAFFIMIISGLNLGLAGAFGKNIGMSITHNRIIYSIVGILYLMIAYYLYQRWKDAGQKIF